MMNRARPTALCIAVISTLLLVRCGRPGCAEGVEHWIEEAPVALGEFRSVQAEVLAGTMLVKRRDSLGRLFVFPPDTARSMAELPRLRAWFRSGRGYLTLIQDHSSARYRVCDSWFTWVNVCEDCWD